MPTVLTKQEQQWLLEQRSTRSTDDQEVLIYPMGAERYLSLALAGAKPEAYAIGPEIVDKRVLLIPGYGNNAFLFAQAGAKSVTVYDKDPVTIAWLKAYKKYYHFRQSLDFPSIGELLDALTCWYPPLLTLPRGKLINNIYWLINPKALRRVYVYYMLSLVQQAILIDSQIDYELAQDIRFYTGELKDLLSKKCTFDTVYVPYLLGVKNGIEEEQAIVDFIEQLLGLVPVGNILVTPAHDLREFNLVGRRYFETTGYESIDCIPQLKPYLKLLDKNWFRPQGLAIFSAT